MIVVLQQAQRHLDQNLNQYSNKKNRILFVCITKVKKQMFKTVNFGFFRIYNNLNLPYLFTIIKTGGYQAELSSRAH